MPASLFPVWTPTAYHAPSLILHYSLIIEWSFATPLSIYARDLALRMPRLVSCVPASWPLQLGELVLARERQGQATPQQVSACYQWMVALQYTVDHQATAHAWAEIFTLAKHHNTTIDEASYLELALRTKLPLATLDPTLLRVAANAGVAIYNP